MFQRGTTLGAYRRFAALAPLVSLDSEIVHGRDARLQPRVRLPDDHAPLSFPLAARRAHVDPENCASWRRVELEIVGFTDANQLLRWAGLTPIGRHGRTVFRDRTPGHGTVAGLQ